MGTLLYSKMPISYAFRIGLSVNLKKTIQFGIVNRMCEPVTFTLNKSRAFCKMFSSTLIDRLVA